MSRYTTTHPPHPPHPSQSCYLIFSLILPLLSPQLGQWCVMFVDDVNVGNDQRSGRRREVEVMMDVEPLSSSLSHSSILHSTRVHRGVVEERKMRSLSQSLLTSSSPSSSQSSRRGGSESVWNGSVPSFNSNGDNVSEGDCFPF